MSIDQKSLHERRRDTLDAAMSRLIPRLRILSAVGGMLILFGSLALASGLLFKSAGLVPVGVLMILGGLFELGLGQHAAGDGPVVSWQISGGTQMFAGLIVLISPFLPSIVFSTLAGGAVLFAGITWLRMAVSLPEKYQIPLLHICGGITGMAGLLILSRWAGADLRLIGLMLGCEMLARGWVWVGFAYSISKKLNRQR